MEVKIINGGLKVDAFEKQVSEWLQQNQKIKKIIDIKYTFSGHTGYSVMIIFEDL